MDTLSFALGIATVVVIAIAIVAVYAFFKVREVKQDNSLFIMDLDKRFEDLYNLLGRNEEAINRKIYEVERDVYSALDSRLDKLESKLTIKK
jgi:hypothetical protein